MKLSKFFLTISIVAGVIGWTSTGADFAFGILRPFSAVLFILALVSTFVEHAEADHRERTQGKAVAPAPARSTSRLQAKNWWERIELRRRTMAPAV